MIASILHSSPSFNAVLYNETKVQAGVAKLIEIKNFGEIDTVGYNSADELVNYLKDWSSQSDRIKLPQFHVALSCKGNEMNDDELLDFAHQYLQEMGYSQDSQPILIYSHHDTDNNHLHIITSRVGPDGKKIDAHHERRKSQQVLEKLTKQNIKDKVKDDIKNALSFNFRSATQFKAIMEAMSYECYEKDDKLFIKKGGVVQDYIDIALMNATIRKNIRYSEFNLNSRCAQLSGIFRKYNNLNSSRTGLENDLRKKFGISLVFFGSKDNPYGYAVIDFHNKTVIEGSKIMKVKDLLTFHSSEENRQRIESYIDRCFEDNPFITTKDLNRKLYKFSAFIKKDEIHIGNNRSVLKEIFSTQLKRNNRIDWLVSFNPTTKAERDLICKVAGFKEVDLINIIPSRKEYSPNGVDVIRAIFMLEDSQQRMVALNSQGFSLIQHEGKTYSYNPKTNSVIDLERAGIPTYLYERTKIAQFNYNSSEDRTQANRPNSANNIKSISRAMSAGGSGVNREWEVGKRNLNPDDPDISQGYTY